MILLYAIYFLCILIKLFAYNLSGIVAILADVLHSVVDILMLLVLSIATHLSKKAADEKHPFGHELVKNVASLSISVAFIFFFSFELIKEGILRIMSPKSYSNYEIALAAEITVLILLLAAAFVSYRREGIINRTVMYESLNDSASTLAAIFGVIAIWAGYPIFDGIITILIAFLIAYNSLRLFKENATVLLGLSPSKDFYDEVEKICSDIDEIKSVKALGVFVGEKSIHLDMEIKVDKNMTVREAEELKNKVIEAINKNIPEVKHISIHFSTDEN